MHIVIISLYHIQCIIIKEKGGSYKLYVNKCQVLKTIYLLKVSFTFRINLKCNVHNIFNFSFTCTL